ncbi:hypothetical protein AAGQ26_13055, partial [Klebsiella pneumoniae]
KSAQIREILISESAWEEMTCLFAPSLGKYLQRIPNRTAIPHYSSWIRYKYLSWENDFYYSLSFKTTGMTPIAADKRIRGWRH